MNDTEAAMLIGSLRSELRRQSQELEAMGGLVEAVSKYRQAVKDHSQDPCQCQGPKCLGDCGPNLAHDVLAALAALTKPAPEKP